MKISCQSCHSKYNVADDKVQGKIVKIRCRKCGTTIVVNASNTAVANGSGAAAAQTSQGSPAALSVPAAAATAPDGSEWHVSVSDSDQRTMTLAELVNSYNAGVVVQDTFVWTDGMDDWKPLGEVDAVVAALHAAASEPAAAAAARPRSFVQAPAVEAAPPAHERLAAGVAHAQPAAFAGATAQAAAALSAPAAESKRAAVKREPRSRDLFATRTGEELRSAASLAEESAADERLTGQRNENSVLFSLEHLTKTAEDRAQDEPAPSLHEDSGIIDLKALAAKAESMRAPAMPEMNMGAPLGYAPPLGGPLGGLASYGDDAKPKSKLPLVLGAAAGIAVLLVLGIGIGLKLGGGSTPSATTAASGAAFPSSGAIAMPDPAASASAAAAAAQASASAAASSSVAATTNKPHAPPGSGAGAAPAWHPGPGAGAKPAGGAAGAPGAGAAPGGGGGASPPPAPAPKKNDCNCNGDLMCMMKCSTH